MKAYFVPYNQEVYGSVDEMLQCTARSMLRHNETMLGVPVIQHKSTYRYSGSNRYQVKIAAYNQGSERIVVRVRTVKLIDIDPTNVKPVEHFGCL